jgi:hypothetical protein
MTPIVLLLGRLVLLRLVLADASLDQLAVNFEKPTSVVGGNLRGSLALLLVFGLQLIAGLLGALLRRGLHLRGEVDSDPYDHQPEKGYPAR